MALRSELYRLLSGKVRLALLAGLSGEDTDDSYDAVVARWRELEHPLQIGMALLEQAAFGSPAAAEHAAGAKKMFTKMDKDSDGTLTAQELREGHREMMASDE